MNGQPQTCHPDRSEAKWRDLRFVNPQKKLFIRSRSLGFARDDKSEILGSHEALLLIKAKQQRLKS